MKNDLMKIKKGYSGASGYPDVMAGIITNSLLKAIPLFISSLLRSPLLFGGKTWKSGYKGMRTNKRYILRAEAASTLLMPS